SNLGHYGAVTSLHRLFERADRALRELASMAINSINLRQPLDGPVDEVYFFIIRFAVGYIANVILISWLPCAIICAVAGSIHLLMIGASVIGRSIALPNICAKRLRAPV